MSEKGTLILAAAERAFSKYGYRRASMADIAEEAGISRPALYLEFKNKEDIFRSLASDVFNRALEAAREAVVDKGTPREKLQAAVLAREGLIFGIVRSSPHGAELLDASARLLSCISSQAESDYADFLASIISAGYPDAGRSDRSDEIATVIIRAAHGLKDAAADGDQLERHLTAVVNWACDSLDSSHRLAH